jgi:hypothetical protein
VAMKFLRSREDSGVAFHFRVHLDTTRTLPDGGPDPNWVADWTFGPAPFVPSGRPGQSAPPSGVVPTLAQYRAALIDEVKRLAALELAKRQAAAGAALPSEGEEF